MAGWAKNAALLIAGRTIQGVGGGGMEALCEVVLTDITTLKERPFYIGILGFTWAAGAVTGPLLGGAFAQYATWRWIAWVNLPLTGIALVLLPIFLTLKVDRSSTKSKLIRMDWFGMILLTLGMALFVIAIAWAGQLFPWNSWQTIFPLILGFALLVAFAWYERYPKEPAINPRLFANRTSSITFAGSLIHGLLMWMLSYYAVLYFQGAAQSTPFQSSLETLPLAFTITPTAIICAFVISKMRRYLWTNWIGWILLTIGTGTLLLLKYDSPRALYSSLLIAPGLGCGLLLSALAVPLQASLSVDDVGVAMGTQVFFRAIGSVFGVAILSAIFTNQFGVGLREVHLSSSVQLPDANDAMYFMSQISKLGLSDGDKVQILKVYAESVKYIWIFGSVLAFIGLVTSFFMKELSLESEELSRQALEHRGNEQQSTHSEV
ncbi:MAG: hypothetical protein Q9227_006499 [Pyrenula ochraceoflavens]